MRFFFGTQAVLVVLKGDLIIPGLTSLALVHAPQSAPINPGEVRVAVAQRVANRIIGNCLAVIGGQLVLPVRIIIDIAVGLHGGTDCVRRKGIGCPAQNVAA